ncbi:MAG TPA: DNRLRE domain-containing protein [Candidatus Pacearchaeota archaeon]|nr:DNRLRE domain-containing protein [Candidatus Pacearchaeota archaeon]
MLKKIIHEYGGTSYITYNKSSLSNNGRNLGFNIWVVNNVLINNSLNGLFSITGLTKYLYLGGKFDYINSEFVGFSSVNETLSDNTTISHFFIQTPILKGKENLTRVYDKNNKLINEVFSYYTNTSDNKVFLNFTRESTYEENPSALVVNTTYSYDRYGNLLLANYSGNTALIGDEKYEYYDYIYNATSYIVDKISNYSLYNSSNLLIKRTWFYYDGLTSSVTKGDLSKIIYYNNKGPNPEINYFYDSYGNIIRETDPRRNFINYTYDTETNTFIYKKLNPLGHKTNYGYDKGTGNLIYEEKDGLYHNYTYDTFGRVTKEFITPDNSTFPTKRTTYNFDGISPENVVIEMKNNDSSYNEVIYFYDGFANPIQIKTKFNPSAHIVHNYLYDSRFRIIEEQAPTFRVYSKQINTTSNYFNIRYVYDALDRITNITKPDNSNLSMLFNSNKVITTNELGVKKEYLIDAYGRIISVSEHNRNLMGIDEIYNTSYYYDAMDNLVRIVDSYGNNFTYGYDSLGRRISMDDPNTNPWTYSYDANGNLINQTDGRNITTFITYDKLNRMIKKNSSLKKTNITFVYDVQYNGTLGNITLEGNYFLPVYYKYTYDNRLRIVWENLSVHIKESLPGGREWINTSVNYDSQDRILNMYLPNQTLSYSYNQIGKLNSINGFLSSINYNSHGKIINKTYANNLVTSFEYDNLSRVSRIQTGTIQNLSYIYDVVDNIKQINDTRNNVSYSMTYDDLGRLIKTIIFNYTSFDHNKFSYVYNRIGNVISKITNTLETNFTYNSLAHAPSNVISYVRISPRLELTTIYPASDINVNQNRFFNYTIQVCCKDNDCFGTNVYLDPQDEGYTPNTQTTCFEERCNKIIYSGTRFVFEDNEWKNIEDARSLKGVLPVNIDEDSKFPVEVIDYNYTSVTLNLSVDSNVRALLVPLIVYNKYNDSEKSSDILGNIVNKDLKIDLRSKKQSRIVTIDLSDTQENILTQEIKWGDASTIITFYDNNSANMDDSYIRDQGYSRQNYGTSTRLYIRNHSTSNMHSLIKFNLSQIPKQALVENVRLYLYLDYNGLGTGEFYNVSAYRIFSNYSWDEDTVNWNNGPTNTSYYHNNFMDTVQIFGNGVTPRGYLFLNVTPAIMLKDSNESIYLFSRYNYEGDSTDEVYFGSKENSVNLRPYLNITYLLKGVVSTTTGETPFYTNVSNPYYLDLEKGQCKNISWTVNATGEKRRYIFFTYANKIANQSVYNETDLVNVIII